MPGCLWFHAVATGSCSILTEDGAETRLRAGELALVPHGVGHRIASDPGAPAPNVIDLPQEMVSPHHSILRYGGQGARCLLVCGAVRLAHPFAEAIASALPPVLKVENATCPKRSPLEATLDLLLEEAPQILPGGETVVTRLAEVVVVQLMRTWLERAPVERQSFLRGLRDDRIGRVLAYVHRDPGADLRLERLAEVAGMSRSAFAARFASLVGVPAVQYATETRMKIAAELLRTEGLSLAEVAARVGYGSEAAFGRAFKRVVGRSPGELRRVAREAE